MQAETVCLWDSWPSYRCQNAAAPDEWEQVERRELSRLIKLAVFSFWQVQPSVHFLKLSKNITPIIMTNVDAKDIVFKVTCFRTNVFVVWSSLLHLWVKKLGK